MSVCFSWSDLEPLFRKQKQAVWLTAWDTVKGIKTYTITVPFSLNTQSCFFESQSCSTTNYRLGVYENNVH